MKLYRRHNCTARHRTFNRFARCAVGRVEWVDGEGPYAVIAWCQVPTITLWPTQAEAERVCNGLTYCGHACSGHHEVVQLVRDSYAAVKRGTGFCPACDKPIIDHDPDERKRCHDTVSGYQRPPPRDR